MSTASKNTTATATATTGGGGHTDPHASSSAAPMPTTAAAQAASGTGLVFVIDRTASMSQWITALHESLPPLMPSLALTGVFDHVAIIAYGDYDSPRDKVVTFSGWCRSGNAQEVAKLRDFAKLQASGGAGCPEAFKSALVFLGDDPIMTAHVQHNGASEAVAGSLIGRVVRAVVGGGGGASNGNSAASAHHTDPESGAPINFKRLHVLHMTDAPPHSDGDRLDNEGVKERSTLGDMFEWSRVLQRLKGRHPGLRYTALTTCRHALYCHLALATGGSVHSITDTSAAALRRSIGAALNGWLGLPNSLPNALTLTRPDPAVLAESASEKIIVGAGVSLQLPEPTMTTCTAVRPRLMAALKAMRRSGAYRESVIEGLTAVMEHDVLALTVSPIIGKLWREVCKMRSDPRRDELVERLSTLKNGLQDARKKADLEEWLKGSYDAAEEIKGLLRDTMAAQPTEGLLRFVPEDDSLCAQQVVQLLARGDKSSVATIRAILARMYVDTRTRIPRLGDEVEPEVSPAKGAAAGSKEVATAVQAMAPSPGALALKEAKPHFRAAVVMLLPPDVATRVNVLREQLKDAAYPRWMPHATLAFPFLPEGSLADATAAIKQAFAAGAAPGPFDVTLGEVTWFPGKKAVLHLAPTTTPAAGAPLEQLHKTLMALFPQCVRTDRDEFHAHVTLGQCAGGEAAKKGPKTQAAWGAPATFKVTSVAVIVHRDDDPGYTVFEEIALPARAAGAAVKAPRDPAWGSGAVAASPAAPDDDDAEDLDSEVDEEEAELPLPERSLPLNMGVAKLMELCMHTVAPGTRLTRRYAALLSAHAVLCGSVLKPHAAAYLQDVKGRWINWRRRADGTPDVPENFAPGFAALMLTEGVADLALTADEQAMCRHILRLAGVLRYYHSLELKVDVLDPTSADATLPDHVVTCAGCDRDRPLSVMAEDGMCGYCKESRGDAVASFDRDAVKQLRCCECHAFYARDKSVSISARSKCHGCHRLGKPSPSAECKRCGVRVVQYWKPEVGLPKGGQCGPCANGCAPRVVGSKTRVELAHKLFGDRGFYVAMRAAGIASDDEAGAVLAAADDQKAMLVHMATSPLQGLPVAQLGAAPGANEAGGDCAAVRGNGTKPFSLFSVGICDALLRVVPAAPLAEDEALALMPSVSLAAEGRNVPALWKYVLDVTAGRTERTRDECAVCLGDEAQLQPACGRKGCTQRVCRDCATQWYGKNRAGRRLYERALLCQFCARLPAPQVLRSVAPHVAQVVATIRAGLRAGAAGGTGGSGAALLDPAVVHGWCLACNGARAMAEARCGAAGDGAEAEATDEAAALDAVTDFRCEGCRGTVGSGAGGGYRPCPGCTVMVQKVAGCHHMTCPCGAHWCWVCGYLALDDGDIYDHLQAEHQGEWDEDDVFEEDEDGVW